MNEGTDAEVEAYLRQLGIGNGAPLIGVPFPWVHPTKMPDEIFTSMKGMRFLKMNGQTFDPETYPELAKLWTTNQLQDLRAQFIRGWDDGRGMDAGRVINTGQSDSVPNITGTFRIYDVGGDEPSTGAFRDSSTVSFGFTTGTSRAWDKECSFNAQQSHGAYGRNAVAEVVPKNVAFLYIVRAK